MEGVGPSRSRQHFVCCTVTGGTGSTTRSRSRRSEIVPLEEISPDARQVWDRLAPSIDRVWGAHAVGCGCVLDGLWGAGPVLGRPPAW